MTDHVVTNANTQSHECLHCGAFLTMTFPASVDEFVASTKAFVERHRDCPPRGSDRALAADIVEALYDTGVELHAVDEDERLDRQGAAECIVDALASVRGKYR